MTEHLLALDIGTSSVRAMLFDAALQPCARHTRPLPRHYPAPGRVEQDPDTLWQAVLACGRAVLAEAAVRAAEVAAIGLTSQRASLLVWDAATGRPLTPVVGWQDQRGQARAAELAAAGFAVFAITPAAKIEAVLATLPAARDHLAAGRWRCGNVDAWVLDRLAGGHAHVTDLTQALATGWCDPFAGDWAAPLLALQQLPATALPRIVPSSGICGAADPAWFGAPVPLAAVVGDQQAATLAEGCQAPGDAKLTLGTSACVHLHTGALPALVPGCYPMLLRGGAAGGTDGGGGGWVVEGLVNTAGAWFDWLAPQCGHADAAALTRAAGLAPDSDGVFALPALQGLGAPHHRGEVRAHIGGLGSAATPAAVALAAVEGVAFRVREIIAAMVAGSAGVLPAPLPWPGVLRCNGGAAASDVLLQAVADLTGCAVERNAVLEATSLGAAMLAGEAVGLFDRSGALARRRVARTFVPRTDAAGQAARFARWQHACAPLLGGVPA